VARIFAELAFVSRSELMDRSFVDSKRDRDYGFRATVPALPGFRYYVHHTLNVYRARNNTRGLW